jgi:hypothetical protein
MFLQLSFLIQETLKNCATQVHQGKLWRANPEDLITIIEFELYGHSTK